MALLPHLTTPALQESLPTRLPIHLGRAVFAFVHCLNVYDHPRKRCLPLRSCASLYYSRIQRSQTRMQLQKPLDVKTGPAALDADAFRQRLVLLAESPTCGDLVRREAAKII